MKLIVCKNYDEVSLKAAQIVAQQVKGNPKSVLGLATGATPVGMYDILSKMNKAGEIDFSQIRTFNLDEYYPLSADNEQSYHYFMDKNLFSKINIDKNNTHILDGMCADPEKECSEYEALIAENGGIDLQVLGIGQNGHIGFNEPGETLNSLTHLTELTPNTIDANSRFFDSVEDVPTKALTMGIGSIMRAKKIILLASGASKIKVIKTLLKGMISTDMPATLLNAHGDVTIICDTEAYETFRLGVDIGGTDIKFGVLNKERELIYKDYIATADSAEKIVYDIKTKCNEILEKYPASAMGVGTPGIIQNNLVTAVNLPFINTPLKEMLEKATGLKVSVSNDANCAALGEAKCGVGKKVKNLVLVTLGTGVGGIVINNKVYEGNGNAGELGHMVVDVNGTPCPCGQCGCWERYASVTALINMACAAVDENRDSLLYKKYAESGKMTGKVIFEAVADNCEVAQGVLDKYAFYLAVGIKAIYNILDPDLVVLSGGITNDDDILLPPIKRILGDKCPVAVSELKSDAGVVGAALL